MTLTAELAELQQRVRRIAAAYGLDFFETIFEMVDWEAMNTVAAYEGFPVRYPHWRFGMSYDQISKSYSWGLSKIFELVINNDPCYAYLLRGNSMADQKLVMAHVYAHCDFFKNNLWFAPTNRRMVDELASHATRIQRHSSHEGYEEVEAFLDSCLSLENLIDIYAPYATPGGRKDRRRSRRVVRFEAKSYMDSFINPPEFIAEQRQQIEEERKRPVRFPERPERDVLYFLMEHAPLRDWQRDVIGMVREEAYYFAPQRLTKVMNEGWACLTGEARVPTDRGLIPIRELVDGRLGAAVSDAERTRRVYDWARFEDRETVRVRTRRGLEVEGSVTHRLRLPDGGWRRLDEVAVGDRVALAAATDLWPRRKPRLAWRPAERLTLAGVAAGAGVDLGTVIRRRQGRFHGPRAEVLDPLLARYEAERAAYGLRNQKRTPIRAPRIMDERLAAFLGYVLSDGHVDEVGQGVSFRTKDRELAARFATLARELFGLQPRTVRDGDRIHVDLCALELVDFLGHLGVPAGPAASRKAPPEAVLRSPKSVVAAFLRAYFDGDGRVGGAGVDLVTASEEMSRLVQVLLLNFGILSRRRRQRDGGWRVRVAGRSAERFRSEIGFGVGRKREALDRYLDGHDGHPEESLEDEIVSVARGRADVYDLSVEATHRYAAEGLVHHNSYWHSRMMTEKLLEPHEVIDFAERHAGALAIQPGQVNPYKLGIELFRDIEERWDKGRFGKEYDECDDLTVKRRWDTGLKRGRERIFEVRKIYNDVTFVDEFLTEAFCDEHKLFTYDYNPKTGRREISGRDFSEIKDRLLRNLANGGQPIIEVLDANFRNRGELVLVHRHDGEDLDLAQARLTLQHLWRLWTRPVHVETVVDDRPRRLSYDGETHELVDL